MKIYKRKRAGAYGYSRSGTPDTRRSVCKRELTFSSGLFSLVASVTVLVFQSASARTGIIASYGLFSTVGFLFLFLAGILSSCFLLGCIGQAGFFFLVLLARSGRFGSSFTYLLGFLNRDLAAHQDRNGIVVYLAHHVVKQSN